jgi:DNA-binding response OmpR family regulator
MAENATPVRSILFVEPDVQLQALHKQTFAGYQTTFAVNASEAIQQIDKRAFSAYVLECSLPDSSVAALFRTIRRADPNAPVVLCSAAAAQPEKAFRAGASAYFVKPVDARLLRYRIDALTSAADRAGAIAIAAEQRAIEEELERRAAWASETANAARAMAAASMARTLRARALNAFLAARGTRAQFEAWWPELSGRSRDE